ncbi:MAG: hypothetical protein B6I38_08525 [Anaerolineaceae bacterium 4572_5.1]|nr:MAG: hypothetical protein B6I38_08525 [Anaerolineaceae bacterium 4572_5.1]
MTSSRTSAKSYKAFGSIRVQIILGFGLMLFLSLIIAVIGYQSLNSLQNSVETTLQEATKIRELSLEIENEFLLARQEESNFIASWRSLGVEKAQSKYASSNKLHLDLARAKIDEIDTLVQASSDKELQQIFQDTSQLKPLLNTYETAFQAVVTQLEQRSRPDGQESIMYATLNELEAMVAPLANPKLYQLILEISANEQAYLNSGQQQYYDNLRLLILEFNDTVSNSSPSDLSTETTQVTKSDLLNLLEIYSSNLKDLTILESNIEINTIVFREVTEDINDLSTQILQTGEAAFLRAQTQLDAVSVQGTQALTIVSGLALGLGTLAAFILARRIIIPINQLRQAAQKLGEGDLTQTVQVKGGIELVALGQSFNTMAEQLTTVLGSLEQQVAERTHALEQRSAYLEGSAEISQAAASILEADVLIHEVVDLIKKRFNLYYVGLFLVDSNNEWAILRAGTGEAGRAMITNNHRLKIGTGMIGWSIANAESRIALDVGEDAVRFANPYLPETRSEGALPLRSRGRVLGALTVQSKEEAAFNTDSITALQTMSDQIAVALDNAELFTKTEAALKAERRAYGQMSQEAWAELAKSGTIPSYRVTTEGDLQIIKEPQESLKKQAAQTIQDDGLTAIIPIKSRGNVLGGIKISKTNPGDTWSQEELELIKTLSEQLSTALESARLYQDTQRRAIQEQLVSQTTSRMRQTLDMETVLRTAASEIREVLGLEDLVVQLASPQTNKDTTEEIK